jgi:hypothetical protein
MSPDVLDQVAADVAARGEGSPIMADVLRDGLDPRVIADLVDRARDATDRAEAEGDTDEVAEAVYTFGRYVLGWEELEAVEALLPDPAEDG